MQRRKGEEEVEEEEEEKKQKMSNFMYYDCIFSRIARTTRRPCLVSKMLHL